MAAQPAPHLASAGDGDWELVVKPRKSARIAAVLAGAVVLLFVVIGIFLPHEQAGVTFTSADQWGIAGVGILIACAISCFTRPRLRAGQAGVETRGFFASPRMIEWPLIMSVEFVPKTRFARLVLPGDEAITLYALQRGDREATVLAMQQLRALHATWAC